MIDEVARLKEEENLTLYSFSFIVCLEFITLRSKMRFLTLSQVRKLKLTYMHVIQFLILSVPQRV